MNFDKKSVKRVYKSSTSSKKDGIDSVLTLIQHEKHRKKMESARNKRYYQRHRDKILEKQHLKNKLYAEFIQHHTNDK